MKRRTVLRLGAVAGSAALLGSGAALATFRLHRAPKTFPKLTDAHLAGIRDRAHQAPDGAAKILFVGNSDTLGHDVPARISALAAGQGWNIWTATAAANGARLIETARIGELRATLRSVPWDALVLQDLSSTSLRPWDRAGSALVIRYMASLAPQARVVLFPHWPDGAAHPIYTGRRGFLEARVRNPADLAARVDKFHQDLARARGFTVAPVLERWAKASKQGAQLFSPDLHHASETGAALVSEALLDALREVLSANFRQVSPP